MSLGTGSDLFALGRGAGSSHDCYNDYPKIALFAWQLSEVNVVSRMELAFDKRWRDFRSAWVGEPFCREAEWALQL